MQKATATSIDGQEQEFMIAMRDLVLSKAYQDADNKIGPDGQRYAMLKGFTTFTNRELVFWFLTSMRT